MDIEISKRSGGEKEKIKTPMIFFASNLTAYRKSKGWTQELFAFKISIQAKRIISSARYQNWELDRAEPEFEILIIICEILEIDDLYLFLRKDLSTKFIH